MESIIFVMIAVLLCATALKLIVNAIKWTYVMAPAALIWIALILLFYNTGAFDSLEEIKERHDAVRIESIENKSRRGRHSEQRNSFKVLPKDASGSQGK